MYILLHFIIYNVTYGIGIKNTSVAPICLLDYLCNVIAANSSQKTLERLKNIEELLKEQSVLGS